MMGLCKDCKYSEVYKEKNHHTYVIGSPAYFTNRKCDKIYDRDLVLPRLDNEEGYTVVDRIDVDDNFGCVKFESRGTGESPSKTVQISN